MNYKGHLALNTAVLGGIYVVAQEHFPLADQLSFAGGFAFASIFLSPDLDLFYSTASKNWSFLRILWWPYSKLMKHRGLSHSLLLATISKLLYMSLMVISLYLASIMLILYIGEEDLLSSGIHLWKDGRKFLMISFSLAQEYWTFLRYVLLGMWVADIAHILIGDRITSALKIILKP